MLNIWMFLLLLLGAYLLGSIPFGLIYSSARGVDIRTIGSGNIGATNVGRQFGFAGGFLPVFLMDGLKGAIPVLLVRLWGVQGWDADAAMLTTSAAALLGHIFPVYLKFKGGKGVATGAGAFAVIAPLPTLIAAVVFLLIYLAKKVVALGSIFAALTLPVAIFFLTPDRPIIYIFTLCIVPLIIFTHKKNISEMVEGK